MSLNKLSIATLRRFPEIADVIWEDGRVKPITESQILTWHFGIVPWVITEEIARILSWFSYRDSAFETTYESSLKSGDAIFLRWEDGVFELNKLNTKFGTSEKVLTMSNVSPPQYKEFKWTQHSVLPEKADIDNHLLQSWAFRLVSDANPIGRDGSFSGYWTPLAHEFSENETLPFSFMKEAANQVIALSFSQERNPEWVRKWSTILLKSSEIWKDKSRSAIDMWMNLWDTLIIVGQWQSDGWEKWRDMSARYSAYNAHDLNTPLFHWKISGTQVPTRMLTRKDK
jgi:hypothetical protein